MVGRVWSQGRDERNLVSVRRDQRTQRWYFRARVTHPDGTRHRIFGTPGVPGTYHDIPNTKVGAQEAERRAIALSMTGVAVRPLTPLELPTITQWSENFMAGYAASHKPSSRRDKRQRLDSDILPAVGPLRLDEVRQEHVDAIVATMLKRGCSRKQVNNTTSVLSALIGYAVENKVISEPNLRCWIEGQGEEVLPVAPADVTRLIDATEDRRYRVAISLAADAGLRIGEIRALPWSDVNQLTREINVAWSYDTQNNLGEPKSWERRTLPMTDRLWLELRNVRQLGPLVFSRLDGKPIGYDAVRDRIHELYVAAKVEAPLKPWHALRHSFGTEMANRGVDIETLRDLMGHKSIETTQRYLHTTRDRKRAAIARLNATGSHRAADSMSTRN